MKKITFLLVVFGVFISCKTEVKSQESFSNNDFAVASIFALDWRAFSCLPFEL